MDVSVHYVEYPSLRIYKHILHTNADDMVQFYTLAHTNEQNLDQGLATEHALANLTDNILAVLLANENNTPATLTHAT